MLTDKPGRRETQVRKDVIKGGGGGAGLCAELQSGSEPGGSTQNSL